MKIQIEARNLFRGDVVETSAGMMEVYRAETTPGGFAAIKDGVLTETGSATTEIRFVGGHPPLLVAPTELITVVNRDGLPSAHQGIG